MLVNYVGSNTEIVIPNNVTKIYGYAFYGCSSLTSVTIPNSVTSIGNYAFRGCSSLTSITIPNSVTSIGGYVFYGCSSLTSVTFNGTLAQWNNNISKSNTWMYGSSDGMMVTCMEGA